MKKNIIFKKVVIILMVLFLSVALISNAYKVEAETGLAAGDFTKFDADSIENMGEVTNTMDTLTKTILSVARTISVTIAIVMLLVIGMKYMVAAPGDRADIKKHAVAYVVGAFILFGVSGILTMLLTFANQISGGAGGEG